MRLLAILRLRWRSLFSRQSIDRELDEELRYHLERQIEEDIARGVTPAAAHRAALQGALGITQRREECRDMRGWNLFDNLLHDFRFALRQLRRNRGFTATAVLMLALGLCASVSIFSFVDAALLQPLPYRDPQTIVSVFGTIPLCPRCNLSYPDYQDFRRLNTAFSSMDIFGGAPYILRTSEGAVVVRGERVTAGFFRTLGVVPLLGRDFAEGEDQPSAPLTTILTYAAWQNRFGGRRDVLGQTVVLGGDPHLIIGVLPPGFHFAPAGQPEFWTTLHAGWGCEARRSCHTFFGLARLRPGVSVEAASANIDSIAKELERRYPASNRGQGSRVLPLTEVVVGNVRTILLVLLSGAGLLLLIAAANVAGLLLVRSEVRRREIAVRSGLGASRARLMSQFAAEGAILVLAGGALGLTGAHWLIAALQRLVPLALRAAMPYLQNLGLHSHSLWFAFAVMVVAAALFTLIPAARVSRGDLRGALAEGGRGSAGSMWRRLGANLVVLELTTSVVLLVGAGLLTRSLYRLFEVNLGMQPERLATLRVLAPEAGHSKPPQALALAREVIALAAAVPGVESAALTSTLPVVGGETVWLTFDGKPDTGEHNEVSYRAVSSEYFATLHARLIQGRFFTDAEDLSRPHVVVIDQSLARKYFPGENPIGRRIRYKDQPNSPPMEVVGVVADIKEGALDKNNWPAFYVAFNQEPEHYFSLVVRTRQDEQAVLPALAAVVRRIDPGMTTSDARSMTDRINQSPAAYLRRTSAVLVGGFAGMALLLSVVGLYGVIAYSVSHRTREIGVRIALGAQSASVYRLILSQAGRLIVIGISIGLACSIAAAGLMTSLLYGVETWDPPTLAAVASLLAVAGLLASFLPARRAASVNPVEALRGD